MDFGYPATAAPLVDVGLHDLSLAVAILTAVLSLYVAVIMFFWWSRLRSFQTHFRSFIFDIGLAKSALCFWACTGIVQMLVHGGALPIITLPARIIWLVVVIRQAITTLKYYGRDGKHSDPPGPFSSTAK